MTWYSFWCLCNKNNDNFTLYSKSLLTTLNISAVIIILDRTHLTCVSSCWCWHLRRIKPMWDLKQVHGVKRRKKKKKIRNLCSCARDTAKQWYIRKPRALEYSCHAQIEGNRTNPPSEKLCDYVFGVADASNPTDGAVCAWESCKSRRLRAVKGRKFPLRKHWLTPSFSTV